MMRNNKVHAVLAGKVSAINDKLSNISYGGCGLAALEMHKALKRVGINSAIVLVNTRYSAEQVQTLINRTGKTGINSAYQHMFKGSEKDMGDTLNGHVCIKFDGKLYDCNGLYYGEAISKHITIKTMEQFLTKDCWNDTFKCRNKFNNDIIGTMEKFFDNLFNKHLRITYECTKGSNEFT